MGVGVSKEDMYQPSLPAVISLNFVTSKMPEERRGLGHRGRYIYAY